MTDHTHNLDAKGVIPQRIFVSKDHLIHTITMWNQLRSFGKSKQTAKQMPLDSELKYVSGGSESLQIWDLCDQFCFTAIVWCYSLWLMEVFSISF